jgi:O-antigen ligase
MASLRPLFVDARSQIAAQPRVVMAAAAFAVATFLLVIVGAAPGAQLGAGYGRALPAVVAILAPLVAAVAVLAPWNGLLTWIVIMPLLLLARVQVTVGVLQVTLTTALIAALVAGLLLERGRAPGATGLTGSGRLERIVWLVASALSVVSVASVIASSDLVGGIPIALHGVIEPAFLLALVVSLRPNLRRIGFLVLAMGASVSIASVYSVLRISRIATTLSEVAAQRLQLAHFTYYNVGMYGDMLAMALPLLLVALFARRRLGLRTWMVALLAVGLVFSLIGLYATFSKSAWIGTIAAVALIAITLARTWPQRGAVLLVVLVVAAFVVPYPLYLIRALGLPTDATNPYVSAITSLQGGRLSSWNPDSSEGEVSISERVLATEAAIRMAVDHPLLGVGPGRFGIEYAAPRYRPAAATRLLGSAHNFLPNVAAELGIPAALVVFGVYVGACVALARAYRSGDRMRRLLAVAVGGAIVGFLIVGATFGIDLYRPYRVMNADVLFAGLLAAAAFCIMTIQSDVEGADGEAARPS